MFEQPPSDHAKFLVLDPGTARAGVLFASIPGPPEGVKPEEYTPQHVHAYGELFLKKDVTADYIARSIKEVHGNTKFYTFLIDKMGSMAKPGTFDITIRENVSRAFAKHGLVSQTTGSQFDLSNPDVDGRELMLKAWISGDDPVLRVHRNMVHLNRQMDGFYRSQTDPTKRPRSGKVESELIDCFDSVTEVLTRSGWKLFRDVSFFDELATVNLDTDRLEYQPPVQLISRRYNGEMVKIGGGSRQKLDMLVTPTHRMVVYGNKIRGSQPPPFITEAKSLKLHHKIKLFCTWNGEDCGDTFTVPGVKRSNGAKNTNDTPVDRCDFAEFMGWYVAEGSADSTVRCPGKGYRVIISQTKSSNYEQLLALLGRLPWNFIPTKHGFVVSSRQLWSYLRQFGNKYNKFVPQWILNSRPDVIRRFLHGAILGDGSARGHKGAWGYYTVSKRLADHIQECAIKIGVSASIMVRQPQPYTIRGKSGHGKHPQYHVLSWTCPHGSLGRKEKRVLSRVPYDGMVYCATVPNGTLIVRRNGRPAIAGNCAEYLAAYFEDGLFWHSPEPYIPEEADEEAAMRSLVKDFEATGWDVEEALAMAKIRLKVPGWEHIDPFAKRKRRAAPSFGTFGKTE